jgi:threonine/homoserine/homoserine lactone efflux protein
MATAMEEGCRPAIALALGVVSGSIFWGLVAAFGLAAVIATYANALLAMKLIGSAYLLWLAYRSARSALSPATERTDDGRRDSSGWSKTFVRGAAMHLTNPKAIFVWLAIVSLALPPGARTSDALVIVGGCGILGVLVFCGYALAFSTALARSVYKSLRRGFEGLLALVFGYAAIRTATSLH